MAPPRAAWGYPASHKGCTAPATSLDSQNTGDNRVARLTVNGRVHEHTAEADNPLLWVLREQRGLAGTKWPPPTAAMPSTRCSPLYRLAWQAVGSLQRWPRQCTSGVRAEPYAVGSDELTLMEIDLKQRAAGLTIKTPAVRP